MTSVIVGRIIMSDVEKKKKEVDTYDELLVHVSKEWQEKEQRIRVHQ